MTPRIDVTVLTSTFIMRTMCLDGLSTLIISTSRNGPIQVASLVVADSLVKRPRTNALETGDDGGISALLGPQSAGSPNHVVRYGVREVMPEGE